MEDKLIKDFIDKILIEDLSQDDLKFILDKIDGNPELQNYYHYVLNMKDNLQSIAETKPYQDDDFLSSRSELFKQIDSTRREFTLIQMVASIAATLILTISYFTYFQVSDNGFEKLDINQKINGDIVSLDLNNISNDRILLTGKSVNNFQVQGYIKDDRIQQLINKTASSDLNINNRLRAIQMLEYSNSSNDLLIDLIKDESNNSLIRMGALTRLSELTKGTDILATYVNLLKAENNLLLQQQLMNIIQAHAEKNKAYEELQKLMNKDDSKNFDDI